MKTHPLYLNGEFVFTDKNIAVNNPATGQAFANVCVVDRKRVAEAVANALATILLDDALRASMGAVMRRRAANYYHKNRVLGLYKDMYAAASARHEHVEVV